MIRLKISQLFGRMLLPILWVVLMTLWPTDTLFSQPEEIVIENEMAGLKNSRSAVSFPHELHMDSLDCLTCHHVYEDGKNILDEDELDDDGSASCRKCHVKSAAINLKTAYHRQCIKCHRGLNREPDNDLPITCKDCHPKK
jgi:hypothetical protein